MDDAGGPRVDAGPVTDRPAVQNPTGVGRGLGIWLVTILAGMDLRHYVFDDGTATAFIIVASTFTLAGLVGWRVVAQRSGLGDARSKVGKESFTGLN